MQWVVPFDDGEARIVVDDDGIISLCLQPNAVSMNEAEARALAVQLVEAAGGPRETMAVVDAMTRHYANLPPNVEGPSPAG